MCYSNSLIRFGGRYFELIGYANFYDIKEINATMLNINDAIKTKHLYNRSLYDSYILDNLTRNELLDHEINQLFEHFDLECIQRKLKKITSLDINNKGSSSFSDYLESVMFDILSLNRKTHITKSIGYGFVLIFKVYQKPISITDQNHIHNRDLYSFLRDYVLKNKFIPLVASINRVIDCLDSNEKINVIDLEILNRIFNKSESLIVKEEKTIKDLDNSFLYDNRFDITSLQKMVCIKGGYVDFEYNSEKYKLALLPLVSLSSSNDEFFDYGMFTWFYSNIIISHRKSFNKPLTDLFLASDIPLDRIEDKLFIDNLKSLSKSLIKTT